MHKVVGIVTNLFEGPDRDALQQFAASFPNQVNSRIAIEEVRLQPHCELRRCVVTVAEQTVHLIVMSELRSGFSMTIRLLLPPRQLPTAPGEVDHDADHFQDVSFLQRAHFLVARLPPCHRRPTLDGQDTPIHLPIRSSQAVDGQNCRSSDDERQTHGQVAHTHGPSVSTFPIHLQTLIPDTSVEINYGTAVRLRSASDTLMVPAAIEVSFVHTEHEVAQALQAWHISCHVIRFGGHDMMITCVSLWNGTTRRSMSCTALTREKMPRQHFFTLGDLMTERCPTTRT